MFVCVNVCLPRTLFDFLRSGMAHRAAHPYIDLKPPCPDLLRCHRYLDKQEINDQQLQLVGMVALMLAAKHEEMECRTMKVKDFIYISADTYTREDILGMERRILAALGWHLMYPTVYVFLRQGLQVCAVPPDLPPAPGGGAWLTLRKQCPDVPGRGPAFLQRAGGAHAHGNTERPVVGGRRTEVWGQPKPSNDPRNNQHNPQYANYWAPLTRTRHTMPHPAQPRHTNHWAPRTRKRHQQEHRPQRPTERSDPTQHAKGRTGDCPGPRKGTTTRRNVTQGEGG